MLIGTRDQCVERLKKTICEAELDGVWLIMIPKNLGLDGLKASYRDAWDTFGDLRNCRV